MARMVGKEFVTLVVGPFCWGKGVTEAEAKRKAAKALGRRKLDTYLVYAAPPSVVVTEMGDLEWKVEPGKADEAILVRAFKAGKEVPVTEVV